MINATQVAWLKEMSQSLVDHQAAQEILVQVATDTNLVVEYTYHNDTLRSLGKLYIFSYNKLRYKLFTELHVSRW